ncbi:glycosyltransferase family 4 protein [Empedobacter falsenii]|uniref:glycosyltransferase family 4 protein n=1 Tax=Empedobacter sp. TaxID=1927715 RepID=UPI0028B1C375|nr:glycosyltransferase family 4 protein [Empedobacter sp.]
MSQNKKILHVINISFVINHFFGNQFQHFNKKGYQFYVACTPDDFLFEEAKNKGFTAVGIPILRAINPIQDIISIWSIYKYIKKNNIQVVVGHSPKGGLLSMIAAKLAGVEKRVFFRHGLVFETSIGLKRKLLVVIEQLTGYFATKVINVSPSIFETAEKLKLNKSSKNDILGIGTCNGIDISKFKPESKSNPNFVIGYVGRLSKDKGINELIDAWKLFQSRHNNVYLHLIGPFDDRDLISDETKTYIETNKTIIHYGLVTNTAPFYNEMNVFILPSYREGFGMVILEASASGIPVITTRKTGCINAIKENVTGIYTDITSSAIYDSLEFYYNNPEIARLHGEQGISFVKESFEEKVLFEEIEKKVFN